MVQFIVYLVEKQANKAMKSSEASTWATKALSDVLSARCLYVFGRCFLAEWRFDWRKGIASGGNGSFHDSVAAYARIIGYKLVSIHTLHAKR